MAYFKRSFTGTKAEIITAICSAIAALSDDIAVINDGTGINIKNKFQLIMSEGQSYYINLSISYGENVWNYENNSGITVNAYGVYVLSCTVQAAVNNNCLNIKIGNYNSEDPYFNLDFLFVFASEDVFGANINAGNTARPFAAGTTLYTAATKIQDYTAVRCLPYTYNSSSVQIEKTNRKVFIKGGTRQFELSSMIDCTNVIGAMQYPIAGKRYYAVDNNTLMEV